MAKKKKAKLRVERVILCAVILIALIVGIVALVRHFSKPKTPTSNKPTAPHGQTTDESQPESFIMIEQDDCTLSVGSVLQLTLVAKPESLASQAQYSTTNEQILTVSENGLVRVVGAGTAAIVAVSGTYTDSIIIDAIPVENEDPSNGSEQPTEEPSSVTNPEPTKPSESQQASTEQPSSSQQGNEEQPTTVQQPSTEPSSNQAPSGNEQASTNPPVVEQPTEGPQGGEEPSNPQGGEQPGGVQEENPPIEDPDSPGENILTTQDRLNLAAGDLGLTPYGNGIYICKDGTYLGQVIVEEDMMQILLQTRTSVYDQKLKDLISVALPTGYEMAYAKMIAATKTETVILDGLKVHVIVSTDATTSDMHKQMIIRY